MDDFDIDRFQNKEEAKISRVAHLKKQLETLNQDRERFIKAKDIQPTSKALLKFNDIRIARISGRINEIDMKIISINRQIYNIMKEIA